MQKLDDKIVYTEKIVSSIYNGYSRSVFSEAIKILIKNKLILSEEKQILNVVLTNAKAIPGFFKKSYIIYLSNGILSENNLKNIKKQLFFELAVDVLKGNAIEKIEYNNENKDLFSLSLNNSVNVLFDSIGKNGEDFVFFSENKEVLRLKKNSECTITNDITFLEKDRNPFNIDNDHPEGVFVSYDLNKILKLEWVKQFRNAYSIIKKRTPVIYDEIYSFLDAIVPNG